MMCTINADQHQQTEDQNTALIKQHSPLTAGIHHVGLTTNKLEETANFFTKGLGWKEVNRNDAYPAIFVSDGAIMLTLWASQSSPTVAFNRKSNIGLHHLALAVKSDALLTEIHTRLSDAGVLIEFEPEPLKSGPAKHMMCYEPGGIRIEFTWSGA